MKLSLARFEFLLPIFFGIASFFLVVGPLPLDPSNISWLSGQDPSQHYLGWAFFRYSPWTNPLGLNPNYGLSIASAIAYSDSIAWLAFLFKPLSPFLSEPFQYIGIWIFLCFILQSWFSWKLVGLITQNTLLRIIICTLLGVFAPPLLKRLGLHAALIGQFLVLAALYLNLNQDRISNGKIPKKIDGRGQVIAWCVLLIFASLTNFYLLVMVYGLWLAKLLDLGLCRKISIQQLIGEFFLLHAVLFGCLWEAGYFSTAGISINAEGFGQYKLNLLSIFDAGRYSHILKPIAHPEDLEEGFNFLGLGIIFLIPFVIGALLLPKKTNGGDHSFRHVRISLALKICLIIFFLFALSNQISLGNWTISYPLPDLLLNLAGILRSSGRFFWPVYYLLVFSLLLYIVNYFSYQKALIILSLALLIQIVDTSAGWLPLRKTFTELSKAAIAPKLTGYFWDEAGRRYKKILFWPLRSGQTQEHWQELAYFAANHQMGTNAVYLGRRADSSKVKEFNDLHQKQIQLAQLDPTALYILNNNLSNSQWINQIEFTAETCIRKTSALIIIGPAWISCPKL